MRTYTFFPIGLKTSHSRPYSISVSCSIPGVAMVAAESMIELGIDSEQY